MTVPQLKDTLPNIVLDREGLIAALEARLPWAKQSDKKRITDHKQAEKDIFEKFKARLQTARQWDYKMAKKNEFKLPNMTYTELDQIRNCPQSRELRINQILESLKLSQQKTFTINPSSDVYMLLTHDDDAPVSMC